MNLKWSWNGDGMKLAWFQLYFSFIPVSSQLYSIFITATFQLYLGFIPVSALFHFSYISALFQLHSSFNSASFLLNSSFIPASFSFISALFHRDSIFNSFSFYLHSICIPPFSVPIRPFVPSKLVLCGISFFCPMLPMCANHNNYSSSQCPSMQWSIFLSRKGPSIHW